MDSEQLLADRRAFVAHLLQEKALLERCLAAIDASIHIYTTGNVTAPPPSAPPKAPPELPPGRPPPPPRPPPTALPERPKTPEQPAANDATGGAVVVAKEPRMFTGARNRVIAQNWPKGTPSDEIVQKCNALDGPAVTAAHIVAQARRMGFHPRDEHDQPRKLVPPPPSPPSPALSRAEVMAKVAAAIEDKPNHKAVDPGEAVPMDFAGVREWAGERHIRFDDWDDLPRVNERRELLNYPRFKRDFSRRAG